MNDPNFMSAGLERPRVLLAEDDAVTRRIVFHMLQQWDYEIVLSKDGAEAWEILQQKRPPELVILDWDMPGLDGIELCRRLRDKSREYYHYILMITSRADGEDNVHARESGADDYLAKPFQEADLKARLSVAGRIVALQNALIQSREKHRERAMKDGMTGLWNRTAFLDMTQSELDRAARSHGRTGLLLLDLDHFKTVNDTYGHLAGDIVLEETARRLKQAVRSYDFVGRYGGEEFAIALPGCDGRQLRKRAEGIRRAIAREPFRVGKIEISITISIGAVVASARTRSLQDVLAAADAALYKAKQAGRDHTVYCEKSSGGFVADSAETDAWLGRALSSMALSRPQIAAR
jgi:diguanylate cyclase (GGDEF)-like protein